MTFNLCKDHVKQVLTWLFSCTLAVVFFTSIAFNASAAPPTPPPPPPPPQATSDPATAAEGYKNLTYPPKMLPDAMPGIPQWAGKDKDEPFDVKKFLESRAAPEDNGATLYFLALADLSEVMDFVYPPDEWEKRLPQVKALEKDIWEMSDPDRVKAGAAPVNEIERILKNARPALDKADQAQQKKRCVFVAGMRIDSLLPHGMAAREVCWLDYLHIYHAKMKDDFAEAEKSISRSLRLARDLRPRGCLVMQLVSFGMEGHILDAITDFTLAQKNLSPEQCDRLLASLSDRLRQLQPSLTEGLKMEYIGNRNTFNDLQNGKLKREIFIEIMKPSGVQLTNEDLANVNWQADIAGLNRSFTVLLALASKPYDKDAIDMFGKAEVPKLKAESATLTVLLLSAITQGYAAQTRVQAQLAGTQCLIAVRKYVLSHNKLPADLATAVSETQLKTVPLDPFDGKPMRYKIIDGKPVVYSVGPDQKDDGATSEWTGEMPSGDMIYRIGE